MQIDEYGRQQVQMDFREKLNEYDFNCDIACVKAITLDLSFRKTSKTNWIMR